MRVVRVYHAGRDPAHRARDRALAAAGVDLTLIVPRRWPDRGSEESLSTEPFPIVELDVERPGDVNRHTFPEPLDEIVRSLQPDVLDIHEEPFSLAARQWLAAAPAGLPVVMYTAQNIDKRLPPPFCWYEAGAYQRLAALYPCSAQAAAVARGKGYGGLIDVLPLGYDDRLIAPGSQEPWDEIVLMLVGRLVPEKGVTDAVRVLERVNRGRTARLVLVGTGPEADRARSLAAEFGVGESLEIVPWRGASDLAAAYRTAHVVLVPSRPTESWVEQFGRVIVEAQASGAVVAGYACGAIPEVAGNAAVLVATGAATELGDRVAALLADPSGFRRLRDLGIARSAMRTWVRVGERQADLYSRVERGEGVNSQHPRSPRARRAAAAAEFGPTAAALGGTRPFALPILRRGGLGVSALAGALDFLAECLTWLRGRAGR